MANLTDTRYKMQGKTVLYVPNEGTRLPIEEAAKSRYFPASFSKEGPLFHTRGFRPHFDPLQVILHNIT